MQFLTAQSAEGGQFNSVTSIINLLLLAFLLGFAVYGIYGAVRLRRTGQLFPHKILYPGNCRPEKCTDVSGFIDYIVPRLLLLSGLFLAMAGVYAVNAYVLLIEWLDYVLMLLPVLAIVWYLFVQNRAAFLYW